MNNRLIMANIKLVDENQTLKNDVEILENRINNIRKYIEKIRKLNVEYQNQWWYEVFTINLLKLTDGEEID